VFGITVVGINFSQLLFPTNANDFFQVQGFKFMYSVNLFKWNVFR